jgi:hypothetical protein
LATRSGGGHPIKSLLLRGETIVSFPYAVFERAILLELAELDPREVLDGPNGHDNVVALEGELGAVEARIAELEGELLTGDVKAIGRVLRQLEARQADLSRQLADARQKAANPLSSAWGEAKNLLAALDDSEDTQMRLRAVLRRIISTIRMMVLTDGRQRMALIDVEFSGEHANRWRSYTVWYRPSTGNACSKQPETWAVVSAAGGSPPITFERGEERGEPMRIVEVADWLEAMPVEPEKWFPLPE